MITTLLNVLLGILCFAMALIALGGLALFLGRIGSAADRRNEIEDAPYDSGGEPEEVTYREIVTASQPRSQVIISERTREILAKPGTPYTGAGGMKLRK